MVLSGGLIMEKQVNILTVKIGDKEATAETVIPVKKHKLYKELTPQQIEDLIKQKQNVTTKKIRRFANHFKDCTRKTRTNSF
jgi:hypothetical protein